MQKGFTPVYLLVGVLILAAVGGAYYFGRSQVTASLNPSASPAPTGARGTANWKTYKNGKYEFEIKYPSTLYTHEYDTTLQDSASEFWLVLNKTAVASKSAEIFLSYPWEDLSYIDKGFYVVVTPKEMPEQDINKPDVTCGECIFRFENKQIEFLGIAANKSVAKFPNEPKLAEMLNMEKIQPYTYIIFNYQNKGWVIAYDHSNFSGDYDPLYDQILSTFRFN